MEYALLGSCKTSSIVYVFSKLGWPPLKTGTRKANPCPFRPVYANRVSALPRYGRGLEPIGPLLPPLRPLLSAGSALITIVIAHLAQQHRPQCYRPYQHAWISLARDGKHRHIARHFNLYFVVF
jgi:hypothetical protein